MPRHNGFAVAFDFHTPLECHRVKETITLNFDGGSRGNPGLAGVGVVLAAEDATPLVTIGKYIGKATNNVAEYMALIIGLREAAKLGARKLQVRGDSELVIKQMLGEYRVKNPALKALFDQAKALASEFESVNFAHNLRHHNSLADRLANLAMDRKADVEDVDDVPPPPEPKGSPRLFCPTCGCEIEVKNPPNPRKPGHFICPCGSRMS
jgi:ribonuclease HI